MATERLLFDIETNGFLEEFDKIHCMAVYNIDTKDFKRYTPEDIDEGIERILGADYLVGHNIIKFDIPAIEKYTGRTPKALTNLRDNYDVYNKGVFDTLVVSRLVFSNMKEDDFARRNAVFSKMAREHLQELSRFPTNTIKYKDYGEWKQRPESAWEKLRRICSDQKIPKDDPLKAIVETELFPGQLIGRHSLKAWGYRLGSLKGDFGGDMEDFSEFTQEMLDYCVQDLRVNLRLYNHLMSQEPSEMSLRLEHEVAEIIHRQEQYGWYFDVKSAESLYKDLSTKRDTLKKKLEGLHKGWYADTKTPAFYQINYDGLNFRGETKGETIATAYEYFKNTNKKVTKKALTDACKAGPIAKKHTPFKPSSRDHIALYFKEKYGWKPTVFNEKDGKPKVDADVLKSLDYPEAQDFIDYDVLQDRCEKLKEGKDGGWIGNVKDDHRIHGSVITNGAVTGRATHARPNLAQVPASYSLYGKECRALFTAPEGSVLVGADADGLELRCLAHYMAPYDAGEYAKIVDEGKKEDASDVHSVNQRAFGLDSRDNSKTTIYAMLYGAGPAKIGKIVDGGAKRGKELMENFYSSMPAMRVLQENVKQKVRKEGHLVGLDGRILPIRRDYAALNTLLQSAGAIICKRWLVEIDKRLRAEGLPAHQVGWVHDEGIWQVDREVAARVLTICEEAMPAVEDYFSFKCPLKASGDIGTTWEQVH